MANKTPLIINQFDYPARVLWLIYIIVAVALLCNGLLLKQTISLRRANPLGSGKVSEYVRRFEPVRSLLPARGRIGYMSGPNPEILNMEGDEYTAVQKEYRLAQYALSPVIVRPATADIVQELPLLIVDEYGGGFFDAQLRKKIVPPQGFVLVRDFANGLLLYRRERL